MTSTLLIVQIVLALAITVAVLLQKSSSIGLGAYSGSNESVFGAKGPTGVKGMPGKCSFTQTCSIKDARKNLNEMIQSMLDNAFQDTFDKFF